MSPDPVGTPDLEACSDEALLGELERRVPRWMREQRLSRAERQYAAAQGEAHQRSHMNRLRGILKDAKLGGDDLDLHAEGLRTLLTSPRLQLQDLAGTPLKDRAFWHRADPELHFEWQTLSKDTLLWRRVGPQARARARELGLDIPTLSALRERALQRAQAVRANLPALDPSLQDPSPDDPGADPRAKRRRELWRAAREILTNAPWTPCSEGPWTTHWSHRGRVASRLLQDGLERLPEGPVRSDLLQLARELDPDQPVRHVTARDLVAHLLAQSWNDRREIVLTLDQARTDDLHFHRSVSNARRDWQLQRLMSGGADEPLEGWILRLITASLL